MSNTNVKLKLLYIMKALMEQTDDNHDLTVNALIEELRRYDIDAERKSIYTDIDLLQDFGMDIVCEKGRSNQYHVASRVFEMAELTLLVDSVQSSKFITSEKSRQLIKKLETLCSVYEAKELNRQVFVTDRVKTMNESIYYNVDKIQQAILHNRQIRFKYFDYTLDKKTQLRKDGAYYEASPYALTWDNENYYMIAYYEKYGKLSHFRVDRMISMEESEEPRHELEEKGEFNVAEYSNKAFNMFVGDVERVELLFDNTLINVVIDRFGIEPTLIKANDTQFKIRVKVMTGPTLLSWLFMFGDKVKILSPEHLKEDMLRHAASVTGLYADK